ncbi:hypothetical protein PHYSODRAFT_327163 [Phytophthora sojae]|uniref:Uncharacterized protein n=1 Tax=Phytophthora sojae (strain P6497) TaxID=1094619 RepID=G4YYV7_PHYSP|nr:hypothetical protein PHYSODRAFT_327163 [Phytophthora sojae]EGZ26249.1 hypothetical protein PHYSODRAFT_327163 [Phytophthora sojae]|eukprot:XP_009521537.1 hypothetical protein PHYSODRAFT_327163 [Phytophthora sojae]
MAQEDELDARQDQGVGRTPDRDSAINSTAGGGFGERSARHKKRYYRSRRKATLDMLRTDEQDVQGAEQILQIKARTAEDIDRRQDLQLPDVDEETREGERRSEIHFR